MKLIFYEWKKLLSSRAVVALILCCIAVNLGYHFWLAYWENGIYSQYSGFRKSDWQEVTAQLKGMDQEEQLSLLHQESTWYAYVGLVLLERTDSANRYWEELQGYPGTDWEARKQEDLPWTREGIIPLDLHKLYNGLAERLEYLTTYPEFLETVAKQAESMEAMSLFTKIEGFTKRNIEQTATAYSQLSVHNLGIDYSPMTDVGTQSGIADGILLILVLLIGWQIFCREQEEGLYPILHSAKKGSLPLAAAKTAAFFVSLFVLCILLYGSQIVMAALIYGIGNLDIAIQSLSRYRNCAFQATIGDYLFWYVGIKMMAAACLGSILLIGIAAGKRFGLSALLYLLLLAGGYGVYQAIDALSSMNLFKYANVFAILDAHSWFSEYRNLNLFSYPLPAWIAKFIYSAVILLFACTVFQISFCRYRKRSTISRPNPLKNITLPVTLGAHGRLLFHEGYKFFVLSGMLPLLLILGYLSSQMAVGIPDFSRSTPEEAYRYYTGILAGTYTDETSEMLRQEEQFLLMEDEEARTMQDSLDAGEITQDEYDKWYNRRQSIINIRSEGFSMIREQEHAILRAAETYGAEKVGFVDKYELVYLFQDNTKQTLLAVLLLVSVIFSVCGLFGIEEQFGTTRLIRSTRHGRRDVMSRKLLLAWAGATLSYLILYVPYYSKIWMDLQNVPSHILLSCVPGYEALTLPLTIGQAFWLMAAIQYITAVGCGIITAAITKKAQKTAIGCIISLLLFAVPCVLFFNGIDLSGLTCAGGFLPQLRYRSGITSGYVCFILIFDVISILAACDVVHSHEGKYGYMARRSRK